MSKLLVKENRVSPENPIIRLPKKFVDKMKQKQDMAVLIEYDEKVIIIREKK